MSARGDEVLICPKCKQEFNEDFSHDLQAIKEHGECTECLPKCPYCVCCRAGVIRLIYPEKKNEAQPLICSECGEQVGEQVVDELGTVREKLWDNLKGA